MRGDADDVSPTGECRLAATHNPATVTRMCDTSTTSDVITVDANSPATVRAISVFARILGFNPPQPHLGGPILVVFPARINRHMNAYARTYSAPRGRTTPAGTVATNPELWRLWLQDVEAQLEANPDRTVFNADRTVFNADRTVFNASPNDGWFSGWCVCENCLAWDHPEGELRTLCLAVPRCRADERRQVRCVQNTVRIDAGAASNRGTARPLARDLWPIARRKLYRNWFHDLLNVGSGAVGTVKTAC